MGEDGSLGREDHSAETSDFLCLLSKTVTVPDPWQMEGPFHSIRVRREPKR